MIRGLDAACRRCLQTYSGDPVRVRNIDNAAKAALKIMKIRRQVHLDQEQLQFRLRLGVAGEVEFAAVNGRQVHVDHLDGEELIQRAVSPGARA